MSNIVCERVIRFYMQRKSLLKNYIYNTAYQLLVMLTPLITTPYISRTLGAENIGIYSFSSSIVSYFTLFATLGTTVYGQREISYLQDDRERRTVTFWNLEAFSCINTLLWLFLYGLYVWFICDNIIIYSILAMNVIAVAFDVTWLFQGMEEFGRITFRNALFKILNIVYVFAFVRSEGDLQIYILGMCLLPLLSILSLWGELGKLVDRPNWKRIRPFTKFKEILLMFVPFVAISIYTVLDRTMLGLFTETKLENGYYEQAIKLSKTVLTLVTALGTVMMPRIGYYYERKETDTVREYMYNSYRFVWFIGIPLCFGLIGLSANLVPWYYGAGYDKVVPLLSILSLLILAIGISNVTGIQYLVAIKRQNTFTFTVTVGAVVNFVLNIVLIPIWYSIGAAIASVFAETIVAFLQIFMIRNEISPRIILSCGRHYWIAGLTMLGFLYGLGNWLTPSVFHSIAMMICGGVWYIVCLLFMKDAFLLDQLRKILHRIVL